MAYTVCSESYNSIFQRPTYNTSYKNIKKSMSTCVSIIQAHDINESYVDINNFACRDYFASLINSNVHIIKCRGRNTPP